MESRSHTEQVPFQRQNPSLTRVLVKALEKTPPSGMLPLSEHAIDRWEQISHGLQEIFDFGGQRCISSPAGGQLAGDADGWHAT